jgi:hypothetical protein
MKRLLVPILFIVAALGGAVVFADDDGAAWAIATHELDWSPIVYPLQRLPLIFSHAAHLKRGAVCAQCHPAATTSQSAVDNLIPSEAACRACHQIERAEPERAIAGQPPARCAACHVGFVAGQPIERVYLTPPPLKFAHAAHAKERCESCHGDMTKVALATTQQLPTMGSCLHCHADGAAPEHCADCHLAKLGGLIQTTFEHGELVPKRDGLGEAHGPGFSTQHKVEARQVGATCNACHDQSECVGCHQGVTKPMEFHPGNYLLSHAMDARRGKPDCSACHRYESFCVACHEREGLGTRAGTAFDPESPTLRFHPAGWSSAGPGPNLHGREAKKNLTTCTSCHREEDCTTCHSAQPGGVRANPHPAGWRGSARCRAQDRGNRRMCLRCHIEQNELGCDWSK